MAQIFDITQGNQEVEEDIQSAGPFKARRSQGFKKKLLKKGGDEDPMKLTVYTLIQSQGKLTLAQ